MKRTVRDGIFDDGLTLSGFLFLHTLFIQRGRHETTWTVLRKFGYNDQVLLDEEYLRPPLPIQSGSSVELTLSGYRFLNMLFAKYDIDGDSALSPSELDGMFSICPSTPTWFEQSYLQKTVETNDYGYVTLSGFLSMWTLMTHVEPSLTLEHLAHLGYSVHAQEPTQLTAVQVTRDKRKDLQLRQTNRNVFSCHVIGPQGAGKSSFMRGFLGHDLEKQQVYAINSVGPNSQQPSLNTSALGAASSSQLPPNFGVNSLMIYGQEKYLICREVDIFSLSDKLTEPELMCDVVCLMYDLSCPRSFEYIAR